MSIFFDLRDGARAELVMPTEQGERLTRTCFRGRSCQQAGNFFAWDSFLDFLKDPEARRLLAEQLDRLVEERQVNREHRIELAFSRDVGWDSILNKDELSLADLKACELRQINKRASALFLRDGCIDAPRTETVTMALRMLHDGHWKFIIGTMYPGEDCGELRGGNLTERRGLVFLEWSNPGE